MLEVVLGLGGIWIALLFVGLAFAAWSRKGQNILISVSLAFLCLQGGCCAWLHNLDKAFGGSGEFALLPMSAAGGIVVLVLAICAKAKKET